MKHYINYKIQAHQSKTIQTLKQHHQIQTQIQANPIRNQDQDTKQNQSKTICKTIATQKQNQSNIKSHAHTT